MHLSKQEIFNKAYRGLESQGFQRSARRDRCLYRGPDGLKCAVGWLIPDEKYEGRIEMYVLNINELEFMEYLTPILGPLTPEDVIFLRHLQSAHDQPAPDDMKYALHRFASTHNLTIPTKEPTTCEKSPSPSSQLPHSLRSLLETPTPTGDAGSTPKPEAVTTTTEVPA